MSNNNNLITESQNSAKPERGIETPHKQKLAIAVISVRTALSPNAGLKLALRQRQG